MKILLIEDKYGPRANPRRGYHDSERTVTFDGGTQEEQLAAMQEIQEKLRPNNMWAYNPQMVAPNKWMISFGYDSGD